MTSILGPKEEGQYATITEPSLENLANEFVKNHSLDENDLIATLDFNFGKKEENIGSVPLDSELGIPGFGLQSNGSVEAHYGYNANLGLVFSSNENDGYIYLNTDAEKTKLEASLRAALSDDASFTGGLGFLQIDAKNQETERVQITDLITEEERPAKTEMDVEIKLDLNNGLGSDGGLTFKDITQLTNKLNKD